MECVEDAFTFSRSAAKVLDVMSVATRHKVAFRRFRPLFTSTSPPAGRFANAPRDLPGKKAGEVALFKEADISDWMFTRNGKIVGGETIKPLLKAMPKADADALRARMETP